MLTSSSHVTLEPAGDVARWGALAAAAVLLVYGASRRSVPGALVAAAATPFAYRGIAGHWPAFVAPRSTRGAETPVALSGYSGVHAHESIRLEKPLAEVYAFWRQFENFPRFMSYLENVTQLSEGRSHWVATGPAGRRIEWTAEITAEVENQVIGWRSLPGADIVSAGSVHFDSVRGGRTTQVTVHLEYSPPAGHVGALFAGLFGREPSQTIREDMRRLKQLLEAGEIPRTESLAVAGSIA